MQLTNNDCVLSSSLLLRLSFSFSFLFSLHVHTRALSLAREVLVHHPQGNARPALQSFWCTVSSFATWRRRFRTKERRFFVFFLSFNETIQSPPPKEINVKPNQFCFVQPKKKSFHRRRQRTASMKMGDVTLARTSVRYGSRELLDLPRGSHFSLSLSLSLSQLRAVSFSRLCLNEIQVLGCRHRRCALPPWGTKTQKKIARKSPLLFSPSSLLFSSLVKERRGNFYTQKVSCR